jgi:uncharacterized protein (DUF1800 family)
MTLIPRQSVVSFGYAARRPVAAIAASALVVALTACSSGGGSSGQTGSTATTPPPGMSAPAPTPGTQVPLPPAQPTTAGDAVRFLEQTTFGPTEAAITQVMQNGPARSLAEQFAAPVSGYGTFTHIDPDPRIGCPDGSPDTCYRENYTVAPLQRLFFRNAVSAPDQLRQRTAFALSQILVISGAELETMHGVGFYQQTLFNFAFDNFRNIIREVTLSPAMGEYLDMVNNPKPDVARRIEPNENYARELLQLFTVGEYLLNPDGTRQVDQQGNPLPTYTQDDIENLARAFTGWTYPTRPGGTLRFPNPRYYLGHMEPFAAQHDTGAKTLLGTPMGANQNALQDLNQALDIIFNHPNVGPFIGRQLIQHLVTSNPSPAYVARVTAVFNNNGQGVRGDMRAVLRAVLLDAEARGDVKTAGDYGKLREPALYVTSIVRALGGASDGVYLASQATSMGQAVFQSPSVFNFYPPGYIAPGTTIQGPQFKIMLTGTIFNRANFVNRIVFGGAVGRDTTVPGSTGTTINLTPLQTLANNAAQLDPLLDRLNLLFMHNTLSPQARQAVITAAQYQGSSAQGRAQQALYLVATSAQYQVEQ